jgi:hypothetical protein
MKRLLLIATLSLASLALSAPAARACDCQKKQQPCECGSAQQSCVCPGHADDAKQPAKPKPDKPKPRS